MRRFLFLVVFGTAVALLFSSAEPIGPSATLDAPVEVVGRATPLAVTVRDRGTGLARVEVRLVAPSGSGVVLASQIFPKRSPGWPWLVQAETITTTLEGAAERVPEGRAAIEVWATDHSWLSGFRRGPRLVHPVTVDLTPPTVEVLSTQHALRLGGSQIAVYRVGADAAASGIAVGDHLFPGTAGVFVDPTLRAALFALPENAPEARPVAFAVDAAGNRRTVPVGVNVRGRAFAERTLPLSDDFLARKVPDLLSANGLDTSGDLLAGYLRINRDLRVRTEARVREICRESTPAPRWDGALLRLPNSAPLSGFGDRRTYLYQGQAVDRQTHLGFDLASLEGSPVPAASAGRVVFAGPLGIYGNTVIVDHGLGLFTLYGHLRAIDVAKDQEMARGDVLGKTGDTGLAGGDHLHFSTMIHGVHVDPVEWWDGHWIHDQVESRLNAYPRAGSAS